MSIKVVIYKCNSSKLEIDDEWLATTVVLSLYLQPIFHTNKKEYIYIYKSLFDGTLLRTLINVNPSVDA